MDQLKIIPINEIKVGERIREGYGNLAGLSTSIKEDGLVQPIIVDGNLGLIAGGRRLQAAKMAGLETVPVVLKESLSDLEIKKYELIENLYRENLTPYEECKAKRDLDLIQKELYGDKVKDRSSTGWSLRQTAEMLGTSVGGVSQDIQLANAMEFLPELQSADTKEEAWKKFNKLMEDMAVKELVNRESVQAIPHFKYAEGHYKVGDVLEGLKGLDRTQAAFAEVDPPYGVDLNQIRSAHGRIDTEYCEVKKGDYPSLIKSVATELYRVLADNAWVVWWFGSMNYTSTRKALEEVGFQVDPVHAIWDKGRPGMVSQPNLFLARSYEPFFVCRKGSPAMRERGRSNVFTFSPTHPDSKNHPTEKPIELMDAILDIFSYPSTITIIPFLGSGVTLRALYKRGQTGFGWDLSQTYKDRFLAQVARDLEEGLYGLSTNRT